ncbi:flagellin [Pontivivens insulae]|uniref:Flagellin C-terminal domain-containing protein n=1 Tax=Pontivivens insulae TaxID=1639689 RepID=A0A2R8A9G9_9RHOB|nr:flagellin [Pontivivens insulae]RED12796.1 flagellin-like hook-associated protein FlgL [Pontivivens insulae]SPF28887.1 hypothetical protein POI8812_01190 [Pontivivens insulae]
MQINKLPDGLRLASFQRKQAELTTQLQDARSQLVTGERTARDISAASSLAELEHLTAQRLRNDADQAVLTRHAARLGQQALQLSGISDQVSRMSRLAEYAQPNTLPPSGSASQALDILASLVDLLNTTAGGRPVASGASTANTPLSAEALLATAKATIAAAPDFDTGIAQTFATGGPFEQTFAEAAPLTNTDLAGEPFAAGLQTDAIRDSLKTAISLALAFDDTISPQQRTAAAISAGTSAPDAATQMRELQADIGRAQQRLETDQTRLTSERLGLDLEREALIGVDPAEAATKVQAYEAQLETLYILIRRTNDLSLARML